MRIEMYTFLSCLSGVKELLDNFLYKEFNFDDVDPNQPILLYLIFSLLSLSYHVPSIGNDPVPSFLLCLYACVPLCAKLRRVLHHCVPRFLA